MVSDLASIVASANISRLSLIGIAKNVGKTTTTNSLIETLIREQFYRADELALTSLGLDGEATDALTGLPKPRYVPQAGLILATTADLLLQAENEGAQIERLARLPGRTALGPVMLARMLHPGQVIIAGPTLLHDLSSALNQLQEYGARLGMIDGAINRLSAAAPNITDACIVCTGSSVGATPELVARRTFDVLARLEAPQTAWKDIYKNQLAEMRQKRMNGRLLTFPLTSNDDVADSLIKLPDQLSTPANEAKWITSQMQSVRKTVFLFYGAFTEELSRELLTQLPSEHTGCQAEFVIGDGTKIFCHSVVLQRLAARGLHVRVASPIRVLALTMNPYTPEYVCKPERLMDALKKTRPAEHPPIIDVISGLRG